MGEDCSITLQPPCYSPDLVTRMKEAQFEHALAGLQDTVEEWNSELCPAMRDHIERKKGNGEDTSYDEDYDGDGVPNAEDDDEDEDDDNDGVPDVIDDLNEGSEDEDPAEEE